MPVSFGFILEAVFECAQSPALTPHTHYTCIYNLTKLYFYSTMALKSICGIQPLPIVKLNDPARFLCTDSVQLRSMMGQTAMLHW